MGLYATGGMELQHRADIPKRCSDAAIVDCINEGQHSTTNSCSKKHDDGMTRSREATDGSQQLHVASTHGPDC